MPWWRNAVCYEVYVRSFADSDGDGIGDLTGVRSRLPYLAELGVDAVWLTPFFRSPQADHGYDVADYRDVDPLFGRLADFDALRAEATRLGLRLITDIVPNHTSDQHAWFQAALRSAPDSPERDRYLFRPGRGADGAEPPNNWKSVFGGPAWTRTPDGEWYLHLFDKAQPDLNWRNPQVGEEFESILRFWLDRGVDGFRIDVAHGLLKPTDLPDSTDAVPHPYWDHKDVHAVYRHWRTVLDSYAGDRMAVAEAWVDEADAMARYIRADELQQIFNFSWLEAPWSAEAFRQVIVETMTAVAPPSAPTWVLSNHDVVRHVSRYGDGSLGLARAKAATLTMLALPGSAYLYQGEELGLPQAAVAPDDRRDPTWLRGGRVGRDGCRVPLPWSGQEPSYGFSPAGVSTWLPQPAGWDELSVAYERAHPASTLRFYERALRTRHEIIAGLEAGMELLEAPPDVLAFRRGTELVCALNCGDAPARPPATGELILGSAGKQSVVDGRLAPNTAAWFRSR
jgi:alpha-glucosidase